MASNWGSPIYRSNDPPRGLLTRIIKCYCCTTYSKRDDPPSIQLSELTDRRTVNLLNFPQPGKHSLHLNIHLNIYTKPYIVFTYVFTIQYGVVPVIFSTKSNETSLRLNKLLLKLSDRVSETAWFQAEMPSEKDPPVPHRIVREPKLAWFAGKKYWKTHWIVDANGIWTDLKSNFMERCQVELEIFFLQTLIQEGHDFPKVWVCLG